MNLPDGKYDMAELTDCFNKDFRTEKEFGDFIEFNIEMFCKECLHVDYKFHKREYAIEGSITNRQRSKRIDFLIYTKCGKKIGVECKNPYYISELNSAVGQVLGYFTSFEKMNYRIDSIAIVSTRVGSDLPFIISKYNLPIQFIVVDKTKMAKLETEQNGH